MHHHNSGEVRHRSTTSSTSSTSNTIESNNSDQETTTTTTTRKQSQQPVNYLGFAFVIVFLACNLAVMMYFYSHLKRELGIKILAWNLEELQALQKQLTNNEKARENSFYIYGAFIALYIFKQTFAIPGSVLLNIAAGALFGVWIGFPLTSLLAAVGSSCCYMLSSLVGQHTVVKLLGPARIDKISQVIAKRRNNGLFFFLLSARVFPMTPNWLLNMSSPIVRVPFREFFFSVLLGLMPYNFVTVQAGLVISTLRSTRDIMDLRTMLSLFLISLLMLVPVLVKKNKRFQKAMMME